MDLSDRLAVSYYKTVLPINEHHKVYLVRHQETGRLCVKKILDIYSANVYRNLQRHPVEGIPRIIASCEEDGRLTVIEEFISGITLRDKIEITRKAVSVPEGIPPDPASSAASAALPEGPASDGSASDGSASDGPASDDSASDLLTIPEIGLYMIRLCGILERLHSLDPPVIHRDIKPSNIMISGSRSVYLLDLNAARQYSGSPSQEADTRLLGTHGYAAPEQYGFRESSPQTDIYSVGRTLKEAVGALPCEDHTFDVVIAKCTQMDPSKRYASAGDLKAAIVKCLKRYLRKRPPKDPDSYGRIPDDCLDILRLAPLRAGTNRFVRTLGAVLIMAAVSAVLVLTALLIEEFVFVP